MIRDSRPNDQRLDPDEARFAHLVERLATIILTNDDQQIDSFIDAHPSDRERLQRLLPTMRMMANTGANDSAASINDIARSVAEPCGNVAFGLGPGSTLGDFRVEKEIGRGGMGIVYEAHQLSMGRRVALKILPFAGLAGDKPLKRFQNEVRAAALLDHSNVVSVFAFGEQRGIHYYAMQLVEGQSLATRLHQWRTSSVPRSSHPARKRDRLDSARAKQESTVCNAATSTHADHFRKLLSQASRSDFYRQVADLGKHAASALQHAHDQGVVHRDIKPANLLLDLEGQIRITDFGLANIESDVNLTATGELVGTLRYMSPEQAIGPRAAQDYRSDIYSLGATLYEMLTLQPVIVGEDRADLLEQLRNDEPTPPRQLDPEIPTDLETILLKSLEKNPADRYQSAQEMADDLQRFLTGHTIQAARPTRTERLAKWARRNVAWISAGSIAIAVLCCLLSVGSLLIWRARSKANSALAVANRHAGQVENLLYAADIQLAYRAWDSGRKDQVDQILDRHRSGSTSSEVRGFEWDLLEIISREPEPRIIGQHQGSANELALFPGHERIATVGDSGMLKIWDLHSGSLIREISTGSESQHAVTVTPDGASVITGGRGPVQIWDVASGNRERVLTEHEHTVEAIAASKDGQLVATGSRFHTVRLLKRSGELVRQFRSDGGNRNLAFSSNDSSLIFASRIEQPDRHGRAVLRIIRNNEIGDEKRISPLPGFDCDLACTSQDGNVVVVGDIWNARDADAKLLHAESGQELLSLPRQIDTITALAISSDNRFIVCGFADGNVYYWRIQQLTNGKIVTSGRTFTFKAHQGGVKSMVFATAPELITCGEDGVIKVWNLPIADNPQQLGILSANLAVSPDEEKIAIIANDSSLQMRSLAGGAHQQEYRLNGPLSQRNLAFSPDGQWIITADKVDRELQLRDASNGKVASRRRFDSRIESVAFSPTAPILAVCTYEKSEIHFLTLPTLAVISKTGLDSDNQTKCQFTPDGKELVCGVGGLELVVLDFHTQQIVARQSVESGIHAVAIDRSGRQLATGHANGKIRLWRYPQLKPTGTMVGHQAGRLRLAFHSDGKTLASAAVDGTVRLWSTLFQREWGVIARFDRIRPHLQFSPDGMRLYFGGHHEPGLSVFSLSPQQSHLGPRELDNELAELPLLQEYGLGDASNDFVVGPEGTAMISDYELQQVDVKERRLLGTFSPPGGPWKKVASASTASVIALSNDRKLVVYDTVRHLELVRWKLKDIPERIALSDHGRFVAIASFDSSEILDVQRPKQRQKLQIDNCSCLVFVREQDQLLAASSSSLSIASRDADDSWSITQRISLGARVVDVAVLPGCHRVAWVGVDGFLRTNDLRTGKLLAKSEMPVRNIVSLDVSNDGRLLATGGSDGQIIVWDCTSLQPLQTLTASTAVRKVRFSNIGYRLLASLRDSRLVEFKPKSRATYLSHSIPSLGTGATFQTLDQPAGALLYPRFVSNSGRYIGGYWSLNSKHAAFCWTPQRGSVALPVPGGTIESWVVAADEKPDGIQFAGKIRNQHGNSACIWHGLQSMPDMAVDSTDWQESELSDLDGSVCVGYGKKVDDGGEARNRAFLVDGSQVRELDSLRLGYHTTAVAVDQNVVIGHTYYGSEKVHHSKTRNIDIMRWRDGRAQLLPGIETKARFNWNVSELSQDGKVIVGTRWPYGAKGSRRGMAFRWQDGQLQTLGDLPGKIIYSYAHGVSGDGGIVVGTSFSDAGRTAFI